MIGPMAQRGSINKERDDKVTNLCGTEKEIDLWNIKAIFGGRRLVNKL